MKVGIYGGEAFPIYSVCKDGFSEIEVDEETLARWKHIFQEFEEMQKSIVQTLEEQGHADQIWFDSDWSGFNLDE